MKVVDTQFDTIYMEGHSKESLEEDDRLHQEYLDNAIPRYNQMVSKFHRLEKMQGWGFILWLLSFGIALLFPVGGRNYVFLILSATQFVLGATLFIRLNNRISETLGNLE
jgi:hypothetical protein